MSETKKEEKMLQQFGSGSYFAILNQNVLELALGWTKGMKMSIEYDTGNGRVILTKTENGGAE